MDVVRQRPRGRARLQQRARLLHSRPRWRTPLPNHRRLVYAFVQPGRWRARAEGQSSGQGRQHWDGAGICCSGCGHHTARGARNAPGREPNEERHAYMDVDYGDRPRLPSLQRLRRWGEGSLRAQRRTDYGKLHFRGAGPRHARAGSHVRGQPGQRERQVDAGPCDDRPRSARCACNEPDARIQQAGQRHVLVVGVRRRPAGKVQLPLLDGRRTHLDNGVRSSRTVGRSRCRRAGGRRRPVRTGHGI